MEPFEDEIFQVPWLACNKEVSLQHNDVESMLEFSYWGYKVGPY